MGILDEIKKPKSEVVRRIFIKRRLKFTGKFEDTWLDITKDVTKFGRIKKTIDAKRPFKFKFSNFTFEVANVSGAYNPHDNESSLWYGYLNQQRTLVKVEVAFFNVDSTTAEYKFINEFPETVVWDEAQWDAPNSVFDAPGAAVFTGIISGDLGVGDSNKIKFNVKPLISVFEDYPASRLSGYASGGISASTFIENMRDETDSAGEYVFRPFFGDTTTYWDISATSNIYANLDTSGSKDVLTRSCWQVIEKLSEAENFVPFVTGGGTFKFISRDAVATAAAYEFHGAGSFSPTYGNTIKNISDYGFKQTKYYSRVQIKYKEENTATAYVTTESDFKVGPANNPWILGDRTLKIDNTFFGTATVAQTAADSLFTDISALKNELSFSTSLILGLDIFDRFSVYYDPTEVNGNSLWDIKDWSDGAAGNDAHLVWDKTDGEQIVLSGEEFKFLSYEIDLDRLENKFIAREL